MELLDLIILNLFISTIVCFLFFLITTFSKSYLFPDETLQAKDNTIKRLEFSITNALNKVEYVINLNNEALKAKDDIKKKYDEQCLINERLRNENEKLKNRVKNLENILSKVFGSDVWERINTDEVDYDKFHKMINTHIKSIKKIKEV